MTEIPNKELENARVYAKCPLPTHLVVPRNNDLLLIARLRILLVLAVALAAR